MKKYLIITGKKTEKITKLLYASGFKWKGWQPPESEMVGIFLNWENPGEIGYSDEHSLVTACIRKTESCDGGSLYTILYADQILEDPEMVSNFEGANTKFYKFTNQDKFPIGSMVKITRVPNGKENGWKTFWNPKMNDTVGEIGEVERYTDVGLIIVLLNRGTKDEDQWCYPEFVLESVYDCEQHEKFPVGTKVKVTQKVRGYEGGWSNSWNDTMDEAVGENGVVLGEIGDGGIQVKSETSCGTFHFPYFALERLSDPYPEANYDSAEHEKFHMGDRVKITKKAKSHERGWRNFWTESMSQTVGEIGIVQGTNEYGVDVIVTGFECYGYPYWVLKHKNKHHIKINGEKIIISEKLFKKLDKSTGC